MTAQAERERGWPTPVTAARDALRVGVVIAGFLGLGTYLALYLVPWDGEWGFVVFGRMVLNGEVRLFQDEIVGQRLPVPFYVIGVSQIVAGPNLLVARLWSLGLGAGVVILTFALGRRLGGSGCGLISALFLVTHPLIVGNYAVASYFAMSSLVIVGGLLAIAAGKRPWGSIVGMACFSSLALTRAHLAVMVPFTLLYLLINRRSRAEVVALVTVAVVPPVAFLAWSPEHLKILAYVPVLDRLVEPLGYRSLFQVGGEPFVTEGGWAKGGWWFFRRYLFWIAATCALGVGWVLWGRRVAAGTPHSRRLLFFIAALALYTLTLQAVILRVYPKSVATWAVTFSPLWALVLGYLSASLLEAKQVSSLVRAGVILLLAGIFSLSPTFSRHPALPLTLPPGRTTVGLIEDSAAAIRSVVPPGERVFLYGNPLPAYLAGVSPYLQQIMHLSTLVPSEDDLILSRSGLWGPRQIDEWLSSRGAKYALLEPNQLDALRAIQSYRPLVTRMETLLERGYSPVATAGTPPWMSPLRIYVRKDPP